MLRIDRVTAEMDVLPSAVTNATPTATPDSVTIFSDPKARERIKELVSEALRDQLRELERRGVV